jgi:2-oxoglutarate dehydrogenase E2 component (dihydrolipoamide succinyltransferase)
MRVELVMPKMGESLTEGTIIKWLKNVGDKVERDEMILEISTDKVDTEVPSPNAGRLVQILAEVNQTVEVGKVIAIIETEESDYVPDDKPPKHPEKSEDRSQKTEDRSQKTEISEQASSDTGEIVDVVMPKMGESLTEGTIIKWLKKVGDKVERDEMILEISTDKVDTEVPSPVAGTIIEILYKENEVVEVGKVIAKISGSDNATAKPLHEVKTAPAVADKKVEEVHSEEVITEIPRSKDGRFYSPLVRTIAEQEKVSLQELESIQGSGVDGRITKKDLLSYIETRGKSEVRSLKTEDKKTGIITKPTFEPAPIPKREYSLGPDAEIIPMDRIRQLIAEHMVYSKRTSAHVTSVAEADVTGLVKLRESDKAAFFAKENFKLTFTPFFAKAVIDGVKKFPMVNVSVDEKNIVRYRRINLGFATALDDGNLIVPVIRNADDLGIIGLARQIYDLSTRARTKKLNPDDIQGGTITLTNVGTFGTLFGTPVINQPQTAIIGVGAIKKRPVVMEIDGEDHIVVRHMMYTSITYDHRVIDGMLAGQCLAAIVQSLESMNKESIKL